MTIVLSGPPGSGKGTQAELIIAKTGITHYSTGDVFRDHIKRQTQVGLKVKEYLDSGRLVPDTVVLDVARDFLNTPHPSGVLFDGFPRTIPQAEGLDRILEQNQTRLDQAIFINLADDIIVQRLTSRRTCRNCRTIYNLEFKPPQRPGICDLCGAELYQRDDDHEATIRNRLAVYVAETSGLRDYYQHQGKLTILDGAIGKDRLHTALMSLLARL